MNTLKAVPKFMFYALSQALRHPATPVSYRYCPECKVELVSKARICPRCGSPSWPSMSYEEWKKSRKPEASWWDFVLKAEVTGRVYTILGVALYAGVVLLSMQLANLSCWG